MDAELNFKVEVFHANEDGTTCQKQIDVQLDVSSGRFDTPIPKHYAKAFGYAEGYSFCMKDLRAAIEQYESLGERYSELALVKAEPKFALMVRVDEREDHHDFDATLRMGLVPVWLISGRLFCRKEGEQGIGAEFLKIPRALLDDTPEVRAKYEELAESIRTAGAIFKDIEQAADPTDYFLKIAHTEPTKPAAEPVQAELPLNTPAPTNPEDDEL